LYGDGTKKPAIMCYGGADGKHDHYSPVLLPFTVTTLGNQHYVRAHVFAGTHWVRYNDGLRSDAFLTREEALSSLLQKTEVLLKLRAEFSKSEIASKPGPVTPVKPIKESAVESVKKSVEKSAKGSEVDSPPVWISAEKESPFVYIETPQGRAKYYTNKKQVTTTVDTPTVKQNNVNNKQVPTGIDAPTIKQPTPTNKDGVARKQADENPFDANKKPEVVRGFPKVEQQAPVRFSPMMPLKDYKPAQPEVPKPNNVHLNQYGEPQGPVRFSPMMPLKDYKVLPQYQKYNDAKQNDAYKHKIEDQRKHFRAMPGQNYGMLPGQQFRNMPGQQFHAMPAQGYYAPLPKPANNENKIPHAIFTKHIKTPGTVEEPELDKDGNERKIVLESYLWGSTPKVNPYCKPRFVEGTDGKVKHCPRRDSESNSVINDVKSFESGEEMASFEKDDEDASTIDISTSIDYVSPWDAGRRYYPKNRDREDGKSAKSGVEIPRHLF
jgi:hypothetical protein